MKILIATDMEGITGVTTWDQVTPGHAEYARFRRQMTEDVNAAIRGASDAGVEDVIVADGHWPRPASAIAVLIGIGLVSMNITLHRLKRSLCSLRASA